MAMSKHVRKTGATTIKRDGKIVGNIGRGKGRIPTANKTKVPPIQDDNAQQLEVHTENTTKISPIEASQQKFTALSEDNITSGQAITLWNLTAGKNIAERFRILDNYVDSVALSDRQKLLERIEADTLKEPVDLVLLGKSYGQVSPKILDMFARYHRADWKNAIASNQDVTSETLNFLADSDDPVLLSTVAYHPAVTKQTLTKIFNITSNLDPNLNFMVLAAIAKNKNTPVEILEKMSTSDTPEILRACVAMNHNAPQHILSRLSTDASRDVREAVSENIKTSTETLDVLSNDMNHNILRNVAEHPNTSSATLKKLANYHTNNPTILQSEKTIIRQTAKENKNYMSSLKGSSGER